MSLMSIKRFTLMAVLATLSLSTTGKAAVADCNCIDDLAHQLVSQMGQLEREYVTSFRGAREYLHGLNDLRELNALAARLHYTAHHNGSREYLRLDAERLDQAFHHFEAVVAEMEHGSRYGRWGWESQSFRTLMTSVGATIHQLRDMALHGCGCAVQTGYAPQTGCAVPTTWSAPAGNTGNYWSSPSSGWYGTSSAPATPAVTPRLPTLPSWPRYTAPSLPTYQGYGRQAVPQRSGLLGSGIFFRL